MLTEYVLHIRNRDKFIHNYRALECRIVQPEHVGFFLRTFPFQVDITMDELLVDFCSSTHIEKVTDLVIGCWGRFHEADETMERLISFAPKLPSLRGLFFGEFVDQEQMISDIEQTDLSPLLHAFPRLTHFQCRGGRNLQFDQLYHEHLETFVVETGGMAKRTLNQVCEAHLPQLKHLELWLGTEQYGATCSVSDLRPLFQGTFPKLDYLGLRNCEFVDDIAKALQTCPETFFQQLRSLDLSLGCLSDTGGNYLIENKQLKNLQELNLQRHFLTPNTCAKLQQLSPVSVDVSEALEPSYYDDEPFYYISASE